MQYTRRYGRFFIRFPMDRQLHMELLRSSLRRREDLSECRLRQSAVQWRNEISAIVPCHRVVGGNGSLTGYAGGIDKKIALLKLEGAYKDTFFVSKKVLGHEKGYL